MVSTEVVTATGQEQASTPALLLKDITCTFVSRDDPSQRYTAVANSTLAVAAGEFVSVVGPTGCGKSTLLNIAAGLLTPSSGSVESFGAPLNGINKRAGYMFQGEALLPWRSALDNVVAGLEFAGVERAQACEQGREWMKRVGLSGFEDRYPHQMSGGMRKRTMLAQTLIRDPDIILMDEPFSALDFEMTLFIRAKLQEANLTTGVTMMIVSHDLEDAVFLADKILLLTRRPTRIAEYLTFNMAKPRSPESVSEAEFIKTKALALEIFQREMRA